MRAFIIPSQLIDPNRRVLGIIWRKRKRPVDQKSTGRFSL
jgi:hypothetical protein